MRCTYRLLPFKRNQDLIDVQKLPHGQSVISVVDGWNNEKFIIGNEPGRKVAQLVATIYPKEYLLTRDAQKAAEYVDQEVIKKFPAHVACVAVFLFIGKKIDIVSFGTINTFLWEGQNWYKPEEISDDSLPQPKFPSDTKDIFGGGNWKSDPFYAIKADTLSVARSTPILIATDGIDDVLNVSDINRITGSVSMDEPEKLVDALVKEISKRGTQKDDIGILLHW